MKSKLFIAVVASIMMSAANAQKPVQTVPSFSFLRMDGTTVSNRQLPKGKRLFFFCFDPGCDHCQRAAVNLNQHSKEYKGTQIYMIGEGDEQKINQFIRQYAPALQSNKEVMILRDSRNEFPDKFQPFRYPAMFLFASDGKLMDYEDNEESMFRFLAMLKKTTAVSTR